MYDKACNAEDISAKMSDRACNAADISAETKIMGSANITDDATAVAPKETMGLRTQTAEIATMGSLDVTTSLKSMGLKPRNSDL